MPSFESFGPLLDSAKAKTRRAVETVTSPYGSETFETVSGTATSLAFLSGDANDQRNIQRVIRNIDLLYTALSDHKKYEDALQALADILHAQERATDHIHLQQIIAGFDPDGLERAKKHLAAITENIPIKVIQKLCKNSADTIKKKIHDSPQDSLTSISFARDVLLDQRVDPKIKKEYIKIFEKDFHGILASVKDQQLQNDLLAISFLFEDQAVPMKIYADLEQKLSNPEQQQNTIATIAGLYVRKIPKSQEMSIKLLNTLLTGLDAKTTLEAWEASTVKADSVLSENKLREIIEKNISALQDIEKERPGIAKTLYEEFGLLDFARYPREALAKQYDERDKNDLPYGILISAREDWKGSAYKTNSFLESLTTELHQKFYFRILESNGKIDIARKLLTLNSRYGLQHKISFMILNAHGNKDTMAFSESTASMNGLISQKDFEGRGVQRSTDFFTDTATVVIGSCSTGLEGGIAQEMARALGLKVIAPKGATYIESIHVQINEQEQPTFTVQYHKEADAQFDTNGRLNKES